MVMIKVKEFLFRKLRLLDRILDFRTWILTQDFDLGLKIMVKYSEHEEEGEVVEPPEGEQHGGGLDTGVNSLLEHVHMYTLYTQFARTRGFILFRQYYSFIAKCCPCLDVGGVRGGRREYVDSGDVPG